MQLEACSTLPMPALQVSSLLGHYARLYGPQILLLMNIFYYLPSIPLLLLSAMCDEALDRAFGECIA